MASTRASSTYVAGEDNDRLQRTAKLFGLDSARQPLQNVREAVSSIFNDDTLTGARMHSVGFLGEDERVDHSGTLHQMTLTRRKRPKGAGSAPTNYGTLQDLFQQPMEIDETATFDGEVEEVEEIVDVVEGGSLTAAVFGIIKGMVGPAILYLPRGFSMAGWLVAIVCLTVSTSLCLYSARRLLECWRVEKAKYKKLEELRALLEPNDAQEKPAATLLTYPELARRAFGPWVAFVEFGIAGMQFGVCLTYLIYVPQNLVESMRALFGVNVEGWIFLVGMVLMEIPLCWIRDIRKLTPTNVMATFLIAYSLASCLVIALSVVMKDENSNLIQRVEKLPPFNDTWYLFVGTSFFVFEGSITLLVPLQEAVFREEDKAMFPMVYQKVTCGIILFYIFFAITCWSSFGSNVKTALTASLPDGTFSTLVQFAYSIAVIFTFPLQAFPALGVIFRKAEHKTQWDIIKRNTIASVIVCLLGVLAVLAIDYLGNVVSLIGSFIGIPIALIFPPMMHNRLVKERTQMTTFLNYCVSVIGVLAMGAASFVTLISWGAGAEG